ncbi:hypothetical protein Avbf_05863 [Armadillidium vulgare]|nr:hypothetical protein Avbf_05863 [Armadillidium vulgare]
MISFIKGNRKEALERLEYAVKILDKRFFYTNFPDFAKKKNTLKNSKILKLKSFRKPKVKTLERRTCRGRNIFKLRKIFIKLRFISDCPYQLL